MAKPDDDRLEHYLAGNSDVSALYREAATETTTPELDARILRAAHRELRPRRRRWTLPLAIAAAVVLSVSVLLQLPTARTRPVIGTDAPQRDSESKAVTAPAAASVPALEVPAKKAEPSPRRAMEQTLAPPAAPRQAPAMMDAPAPSLTAPARDEAIGKRSDTGLGTAQSATPAPALPAGRHSAPQFTAPAATSKAAEGAASSGNLPMPVLSPDDWISRIRTLRADGDDERAARELLALRTHYPDHVLPPDLRTPAP